MKINAIIIDDDIENVKLIESYLMDFEVIEVISTFNNPICALHMVETSVIDVVFLEINLPQINGLNFIRSLQSKPNIVITTWQREYAVESYELDVLDYLVKPIPFIRFIKTINKITQAFYAEKVNNEKKMLNNNENSIFLKVDKKLVKIKFHDITFIQSVKDYIKIYTINDSYLIHKSLTSITEELPKQNFLRIHRSYTIAIDKIVSVEGNLVEISSERIPIGRKYINQAKQRILKIQNY